MCSTSAHAADGLRAELRDAVTIDKLPTALRVVAAVTDEEGDDDGDELQVRVTR
jgi:hypothetical protein